MREHPDHHDAELLLRLYELRREEKLRRAREWVLNEFQAEPAGDALSRYPLGTEGNTFIRMAAGYWEMAASIVNHGLIQEQFFFENSGEIWAVWMKIAPLVPALRETFKDPHRFENLETAARNYEQWMEKRSPGTLAVWRERIRAVAAKKA